MFGRSPSTRVDDPELGSLVRSRRVWRGVIHLHPHGAIPLVLPGSRSQPEVDALALARTIPAEFVRCRAAIADALAEHRATALGTGVSPRVDRQPPPSSAQVIDLDGRLTIQLAYRVDWDDDHTLGATLREGRLIELNGSIRDS